MVWLRLALSPFLLLIAASCIPVICTLVGDTNGKLQLHLKLRWLFWTIREKNVVWPKPVVSEPKAAKTAKPPATQSPAKQVKARSGKKVKTKQQRKKPRFDWRLGLELGSKYLPKVWRSLHLRCLWADVNLQLEDPALMGLLFGLTGAANWPKAPTKLHIELADETKITMSGKWQATIFPSELLMIALQILWEQPVRQMWVKKIFKKGEKKHVRSQDSWRPAREPDLKQNSHRGTYHSG